MLNHDTRLYPHHLEPKRRYDFAEPLAVLTRHPSEPGRWGLKNLGQSNWVVTALDGQLHDVAPGRNIGLAAGLRIDFGQVSGSLEG